MGNFARKITLNWTIFGNPERQKPSSSALVNIFNCSHFAKQRSKGIITSENEITRLKIRATFGPRNSLNAETEKPWRRGEPPPDLFITFRYPKSADETSKRWLKYWFQEGHKSMNCTVFANWIFESDFEKRTQVAMLSEDKCPISMRILRSSFKRQIVVNSITICNIISCVFVFPLSSRNTKT